MSNPFEKLNDVLLTEQQWFAVYEALNYVKTQAHLTEHTAAVEEAYLRGAADAIAALNTDDGRPGDAEPGV